LNGTNQSHKEAQKAQLERSERADGGPSAYRVVHRVKRWMHDAAPRIERTKVEGTLPLVV
jgi:hypothetical protein